MLPLDYRQAQAKRRIFLKNLNRIFSLADEDNSGGLSRAEFLNAVPPGKRAV